MGRKEGRGRKEREKGRERQDGGRERGGGSGGGGMGEEIPLHLCSRNESNLRPLVAKESHCSGLRKGEFSALELQCQLQGLRGYSRFPKRGL